MVTKHIDAFDLGQIANSGQCFRMAARPDGGYRIIAGEHYLIARQEGNKVSFLCSQEEYDSFWENYFDAASGDYEKLISRIDPDDSFLTGACACGRGIRILRQDLWEMIITFIISQQNNIPRIKKCVEAICSAYGKKLVSSEGETYFSFPLASELAEAGEEKLRALGLGYRAKYISKTAAMVAEGSFSLESLLDMDYESARKELLKLPGVGVKVADCICLFALHHIDAFPVDTHINAVLEKHYKDGFPFDRYEGYAGILQQYAFYYDLYGESAAALSD